MSFLSQIYSNIAKDGKEMSQLKQKYCKLYEESLDLFDISCMRKGGPPSSNVDKCLLNGLGMHCQVNNFHIFTTINYISSSSFMSQ